MEKHSDRVITAKEILGVVVKNAAMETLGKIEELVLDKKTGQTLYLVLACDTILGMGGKYFALPYKSIFYDVSERCFILDVEKESLKNAPGFDKSYWPDTADSAFYRYTEKTF